MACPVSFVDRYADAAVMQTTSVAMDAARPALAALLQQILGVRVVVVRDDGSARDFEGLPRVREIAAGAGATEVVYRLGENRLQADLLTDSKTGGFLDQADNHAAVAALAPPGLAAWTLLPTMAALPWPWRDERARCWPATKTRRPWRAPRPTRPQPPAQP